MVWKLILQALAFAVVSGAMLVLCAGTTQWVGAWIFLGAMQGGSLVMSLWLAARDPELLKDRLSSRRQKKGTADRLLMPLLHVSFFLWLAAMAFDVRLHGTNQMPTWLNALGGAAILAAFLTTIRVFRENTYATAIVKVQPERRQTVVDTGPYALVRHPLYAVALFTYLAIPFALGSWIGLLGLPLLVLIVAVRASLEEQVLATALPRYCDYMARVPYRFVPFVW